MRTNPLKFFGARRRMSVFSVCRQGLTALPVVLALMACDQLAPTGGSGKLVAVKIRAVRVAGGTQNETVTRAGWRSQGGYRTTGNGPNYILLCYASTAGIQYASQGVYGGAWWSVRCVKNR